MSSNKLKNAPASEGAIDNSIKDTFPASDPPATHLPDNPPSNAGDKWAAVRHAKGEPKNPPVDEADDAPAAAPGDIGEG